MIRNNLAALALGLGLGLMFGVGATAPTPAEPTPNDYSDGAAWLCRPDVRPNACDVDMSATVIEADGATRVQPYKADPKAPIDCFYVYPTVSLDPGLLSTMRAEPAELNVVRQQFARLGASCRLFAPLYRQFTLTALFASMQGHPPSGPPPAHPLQRRA
jgi:hypothetical protein